MSARSWGDLADRVLATLFVPGQPAPTPAQLRDAYPFGERRYWPYKVWGMRVKAWKHAHALGMARPTVARRSPAAPRVAGSGDTATMDLFR